MWLSAIECSKVLAEYFRIFFWGLAHKEPSGRFIRLEEDGLVFDNPPFKLFITSQVDLVPIFVFSDAHRNLIHLFFASCATALRFLRAWLSLTVLWRVLLLNQFLMALFLAFISGRRRPCSAQNQPRALTYFGGTVEAAFTTALDTSE